MLSDNYITWWKSLSADAKKELCYAVGMDMQTLRNLVSLKRSPSNLEKCMSIMQYSVILASKYNTLILTPHDLDTSCNIKTPLTMKG